VSEHWHSTVTRDQGAVDHRGEDGAWRVEWRGVPVIRKKTADTHTRIGGHYSRLEHINNPVEFLLNNSRDKRLRAQGTWDRKKKFSSLTTKLK